MKNRVCVLIKQLLSFGFVGGIITLLSLLIYWGCIHVGIHYEIANAFGFVVTVALAYVLNNRLTFRSNTEVRWSFKALLKTYASYSVTGLFMASGLLWLWTHMFGINENYAPLLNLFFTIPINFVLNKFWVFRGK